MYAMDWRHYMPDVARFTGMDALSDVYENQSPYHFALNNPANYSDPTGLYSRDSNGNISTSNQDEIRELMGYFGGGGNVGGLDSFISQSNVMALDQNIDEVLVTGRKGGGFGEGTYNSAMMYSAVNKAAGDYNQQQARSRYYEAEANCEACQEIKAFEQFLFIDVPLSFAGGALFSAGWRALGAGKYLGQAFNYLTKGGPTFAEYRAAYWAKNIKPAMKVIEGEGIHAGKQWNTFTELHHRFIPQRAKWAPNWLLNNRFNLQPLNSLEHAMADPYRARFTPKWVKDAYNLTWK